MKSVRRLKTPVCKNPEVENLCLEKAVVRYICQRLKTPIWKKRSSVPFAELIRRLKTPVLKKRSSFRRNISPQYGWQQASQTGRLRPVSPIAELIRRLKTPVWKKRTSFRRNARPSDWNLIQYSAHAGSLGPEMGFAIPDLGFNPMC